MPYLWTSPARDHAVLISGVRLSVRLGLASRRTRGPRGKENGNLGRRVAGWLFIFHSQCVIHSDEYYETNDLGTEYREL